MLYRKKNPHGGAAFEPGVTLDMSANTNPLGTPPGVLEAVKEALGRVRDYPDPYCRELIAAIAAFEGVPGDCILCGNGAAELICAFGEAVKPATALETAPTFSEYALGVERWGCRVDRYPLRQENGFLLDEGFLTCLEERRPEAVFLCTPNNPTGRLIAPGLLDRVLEICAGQGTRLFLDECFLGLSEGGVSMKCRLGQYPGLFILKAYTKSYGMAGLRLRYCLTADTDLLSAMSELGQPWNVSVPAQAAGIAALREADFLARANAVIRAEKPRLKAGLEALGCWVCPSEANYLLFRGPKDLGDRLLKRGIALRSCANYHGLGPGWYRTAVKTREENDRLLAAMAGEE
jgi:threonine-phosphate decarboxylase